MSRQLGHVQKNICPCTGLIFCDAINIKWCHNVFSTQIIRKIYSVPLRFYSEPLMLSSEPLNLKSMKKCFMSYLILKTYKLKDRKLNLKFCGQLIKISCIAPRPGNLVK